VDAGDQGVTVRFFASIEELFGRRETLLRPDEAATVGAALGGVCSTPARTRGVFAAEGKVRPDVVVLLNGRNIVFLQGLCTPLQSGDVVSLFPPIKGG
jgi:molybdopterin synthase sulfur carrier subunit